MNDYQRIARAIAYIQQHHSAQPTLEQVAAHIYLSPAHFQRLFSQWAGVSPKKLLQTLTLEQAKQQLHNARHSLQDAAFMSGLSGTSRLYDHFVQLEAVTPGEYRQGGEGMTLHYGSSPTPYGEVFVALSERGINRLRFVNDALAFKQQLQALALDWPKARLFEDPAKATAITDRLFEHLPQQGATNKPLSLWVKGTNFQINVWRALLNIAPGEVTSYRQLAGQLGNAKACRAVGSAVGANPVALIIPCHRVLQQSGALGGYRWGVVRKQAMLARELAIIEANDLNEHAQRDVGPGRA